MKDKTLLQSKKSKLAVTKFYSANNISNKRYPETKIELEAQILSKFCPQIRSLNFTPKEKLGQKNENTKKQNTVRGAQIHVPNSIISTLKSKFNPYQTSKLEKIRQKKMKTQI